MSKRCQEFEVEIVAVGAGELTSELDRHVQGCESCAKLRTDALAMAEAVAYSEDDSISTAAAIAMSRRALSKVERRRSTIWIAPLISASVSAAVLILYFGLVPVGDTAPSVETTPQTTRSGSLSTLTPSLPAASETSVPDSMSALRELLLTTDEGAEGEL